MTHSFLYRCVLTAGLVVTAACPSVAEDFGAGDAFLREQEINSALDGFEKSSIRTVEVQASSTSTVAYSSVREVSSVGAEPVAAVSGNAVTLDSLDLPSQEKPLDYTKVKEADNDPNHSTNQYFNKVVVHGEMKASFGINSDSSVTFLRANGNLTERNFSLLTRNQLFNGKDTYDPALYPSLKLWMDAPVSEQVSTHLSLAFDPWSYVGKSKEFIVNGVGGDSAKIQYISWGNTGYTLGQSFYTRQNEIGRAHV